MSDQKEECTRWRPLAMKGICECGERFHQHSDHVRTAAYLAEPCATEKQGRRCQPCENARAAFASRVGSASVSAQEPAIGPMSPVQDSSSSNRPSSARVEQARVDHLAEVEVAMTDVKRDFSHRFNDCLNSADRLIACVRQESAEEVERLVQLSQQMQAKITELSANERHFRNAIQPLLEGEDDKVKAIQLLCKAGRDEMLRAETAEQQLALAAEEIARLKLGEKK